MLNLFDQLEIIQAQASYETWTRIGYVVAAAFVLMLAYGPAVYLLGKFSDAFAWAKRHCLQALFVAPFVLSFAYMGMTKSQTGRVTYPYTDVEQRYLTDAGSYVTNGLVHVSFAKSILVPNTADFQGWYRPVGSTNDEDWVRFINTTFALFTSPQDIPFEGAETNDFQFFTTWSPAPTAHTNGVATIIWHQPIENGGFKGRLVPWRTGIYLDGQRAHPNPAITNGPPIDVNQLSTLNTQPPTDNQ